VLGLCTLAAAFAGIRIRHYLVCVRAQRTLDRIQHLEIGSPRACEVFADLHKAWGSQVTSGGVCNDPNNFSTNVEAVDPPYRPPFCGERQPNGIQRWLVNRTCATYEALTGEPIVLRARIEAAGSVVTRKWSAVYTEVPDNGINEDLPAILGASADAPEQVERYSQEPGRRGRDATSDAQQHGLHPSYRVFVNTGRVNQDTGGGSRAFYIQVEIGPDGSKSDSERLFRFDLSCFRRIRPCSQRDLMPAAYAQYETDVRQTHTSLQ